MNQKSPQVYITETTTASLDNITDTDLAHSLIYWKGYERVATEHNAPDDAAIAADLIVLIEEEIGRRKWDCVA